ncbi:MAG: hypothetical protein ACYCR4_02995 [Acidimicrobiales bacterium]
MDVATLLLTGSTRDRVSSVERGEVLAAANDARFDESSVNPAS